MNSFKQLPFSIYLMLGVGLAVALLLADWVGYFFYLLPFVGVVLAIANFWVFSVSYRAGERYKKVYFFRYFLGLGLVAILTQWSYVNAPKHIFTNAEHHVIEWLGFTLSDNQLILADDQHPQQAIWDTKAGRLALHYRAATTDFQLRGEQFLEPIFAETASSVYTLQNPIINHPIRQQFSINLDSLGLFRFRLQANPDSASSFLIVRSDRTFGPFAVPVKMPLQKGYSLGGLVAKTRADVPQIGDIIAALDSVYLLRQVVSEKPVPSENLYRRLLDKLIPRTPNAKGGDIVLFPSAQLIESSAAITIDNQPVSIDATQLSPTVSLSVGQAVYFGLWSTRNPVYITQHTEKESTWQVRSPQREYLKPLTNESESLFLTSSASEVAKSDQMAGFYYPVFEHENNQNHIAANLSYRTGSTRQRMQFRIVNYDQNSLEGGGLQTVAADSVFRVASRSSGTQWLFRIKNLKAVNPLQFWHMVLLTLLLVGSIYGCMLLTPADSQNKTEYIVYLLVLVLMTIRSILLWRASTFLPVEDITPNEYRTLAQVGWSGFLEGAVCCLGFFALLASWKVWQNLIRQWAIRLTNRLIPPSTTSGLSRWLLLGFSLYLLAFVVKLMGGKLERMGAIYLPLFTYFLLDYGFLKALTNAGRSAYKDPDYRLITQLNWLICLGYLALADAGFSIIFVVSTLVFRIVWELSFPRESNQQSFPLRALLWGLGLVLFIWFSPYLLAGLFRSTKPLIFGLAGVCILTGVRAIINRQPLLLFGHRFPVWMLPGLYVGLAGLLVGLNGPISQEVQDKSYVRYRSEVLISTPDAIIKQEAFRFNLGNDSELLRAAQNQWFINYFYQKGDWMPHHYFRLAPSFKKGSPYLTQICDLVTVRYVIGEHSQFVITFLLSLMIVLILSAADADTLFNRFSSLRLKLLCLLFATGLFVWMAATNRIVFLGQDFPLLSLNSRLSYLFTFTILLVVLIWGDQARKEPSRLRFAPLGQNRLGLLLRTMMLLFIFGLVWYRPHTFSEETFNLEQTISNLQTTFDHLNESFARFQTESPTTDLSIPQVVQRFDESPYAPPTNKDVFKDNPFAQSAYRAYINLLKNGQNDPDNLIHIRRRHDEVYQFAVNRLFYNVTSPDVTLNDWRGHILADAVNPMAALVNRQTNRRKALSVLADNATLKDSLDGLFNQHANNNLYLTQLPASWSPDSLPILIVSDRDADQNENRASFVLKNGQDVFRSNNSRFAVLLRPNDVLQIRSAVPGQQPATLRYEYEARQYFAKNVWLNGHQQFFYPLGSKFLWSYHFANLIKNKYEQNKKSYADNVQLSLDPQLTEQISDLAATYFHENKWGGKTEQARAFNLVVLGSDGKLRALCDYKKGATPRIDPNQMSRYQGLFTSLYMNAQTDRERMLFGNRCLMRMDNGPASTFKPILYSAVTSQYRFDWENLWFGGLPANTTGLLEPLGESARMLRFGGEPVNFTVENSTLGPHHMWHYISSSTNTYNSMMVFLGSLSKQQIQREPGRFLVAGRSIDPTQNFPLLRISNTDYRLQHVSDVDYTNPNSLLGQGLRYNFDLATQPEHVTDPTTTNLALGLDDTFINATQSSSKVWSFPEASHLYLLDRNNLQNAIVQCATGADPINTTPYKMAEMAARLFSFNKAFRASVLENTKQIDAPWKIDNTWHTQADLTTFFSHTLFDAMHQSTLTGTARGALSGLFDEFPGYHFYAKTGTISGNRDGGKRDKHLMLVISREALHGRALTPRDLKNNRFMVLYFSFYKQSSGAEWDSADDQTIRPTLQEMVRTVIRSNSFTNLMHESQR